MRSRVSIVIPVYNEAQNLDELLDRTLAVGRGLGRPFEIVLVDDGSRDASPQMISFAAESHPDVVGVLLNRNYGQHAAVLAGFAEARGEIIITMDADLQNPPEEIPPLVAAVDEGADVVGTVRVDRCDTRFRRWASRLVNLMARKATGVSMRDYGCMLRAYRRSIVAAMLQCPERSTFIPILANSFARHAREIEVRHAARANGDSKYGLWRLINLQFDLLTSMTTLPLRLLSVVGGLLSAGGIVLGLLILVARLVLGSEWAVQGIFTLFALLFFLVGVQIMALGLLGEYLGRIYHDVRARPRYFVHRVVNGENGSAPTTPTPVSDTLEVTL